MEFKGKLVRWNDDRGFGFIKVSSSEEDIFIHISALKGMPRRPIDGDVICFQVEHDENDRASAKSARIEGLAKTSRKPARIEGLPKSSRKPTEKGTDLYNYIGVFWGILLIGLLLFCMIYIYSPSLFEEDFTGYQCEGKQHCSQMTCKEARFYIKNCPNVKIDGDGDGIPCEQQCRDEY
ncbi:cold shock domain-containing protein [Anaerolineales bacterium HSG25]|nr:cold shock domain-containing protein [Anaerolineales bacterium HSG25]